ncbi:MAG: alpha/beta hydrolase [Acidobacteriaceae bacterium]
MRMSSNLRTHALAAASTALLLASVMTQTSFAQRSSSAIPHGPIVLLWPEGAPGAVGATEADKPHLEVFEAAPSAKGEGPRTGVIVAPGGGYTGLAYDKEGTRIAEWLNLQGVTAFVLTYRLSPRYHYPAPILDGERAVRFVRSHAAEYNVAPNRIGMWGFSAGGHLTGVVATLFDHGNPSAKDPVDRASDRPDFAISSYGRLSLDPSFSTPATFRTLLGDHPAPGLRDLVSPDKHVTAHTPPFFLFSTTEDQTVPSLCSVLFYEELKRNGVPSELHIFEEGPHGTALGEKYLELANWPMLLSNWMRLHGWMPLPK